jgi:hypothetical protein
LTSLPILSFFYPDRTTEVCCDSSDIALGVILVQVLNKHEFVIAYGSRLLSKSELNYAQIEKEMLSIVFGVQLFRCYLYGLHFTVVTYHLPLTAIRFNKTNKSSQPNLT